MRTICSGAMLSPLLIIRILLPLLLKLLHAKPAQNAKEALSIKDPSPSNQAYFESSVCMWPLAVLCMSIPTI